MWRHCLCLGSFRHEKSMHSQQFGNKKSSSTTHCLVSFLDFLHSHLDKRNTFLAIDFVDFMKALDLVYHTVVITKAIRLGLHPNLIIWLVNFLSAIKAVFPLSNTWLVGFPGAPRWVHGASSCWSTMSSLIPRIVGSTWTTAPIASASTPGFQTFPSISHS